MSIPVQQPFQEYQGNGVTTDFPYLFLLLDAGEVTVLVDGITQVLNVDYTVTDVNNVSGGLIVFAVAPTVGVQILIRRVTPLSRIVKYQDGGDLPAETLNRDFDRLWMRLQDFAEELGRALQLPATSTTAGLTVPEPVAARYLRWNATLTGLENADLVTSGAIGIPVPVLQGGTGSTNAAAARAALGVSLGNLGATVVNKNRFANGAFAFDQLNLGAAVSVSSGPEVRVLDCTIAAATGAGVFTVQQISSGGPVGSPTFVRMAVTTADASMAATDQYQFIALVEGLDTADLAWGSGGALPISLGFWFRSSLTGTFSGSIRNAAANRSYAVSWSYTAANVWQFIPLPNIPGDATGSWPNGNARSMLITISLGAGSNFGGATGAWTGGNVMHATGAVNLISTLGATMDIALMQLEAGASCTPFEWSSYQSGLARVQRYFETGEYFVVSTITPSAVPFGARAFCQFKVTKRAVPSAINGTAALSGFASASVTSFASGYVLFGTTNVSGECSIVYTNWSAAAHL